MMITLLFVGVYSIDTLVPFVTIALSVEKLVNINLINVFMDTVYF